MADGLGDASLIGHLHDKISENMEMYGLSEVTTYLAVEKKISEEKLEAYNNMTPRVNVKDFDQHNEYVDDTDDSGYKQLVSGLSKAREENIVWAANESPSRPQKTKGYQASPIPKNNSWEIQYPVPMPHGQHNKMLKIKEMGYLYDPQKSPDHAKTGELHGGMGYGIPRLKEATLEEDEENILAVALGKDEELSLANAWIASVKTTHSTVNVLRNLILGMGAQITKPTLLFIPGGTPDALQKSFDQPFRAPFVSGNLSLYSFSIEGKKIVIILGTFRNEFLHHLMGNLQDGVILSGGEGLYAESLATQGKNVAPIFAARYGYQWDEVASAIATNQGPLETQQAKFSVTGDRVNTTMLPVFQEYGLVRIEGTDEPTLENRTFAFRKYQDGKLLHDITGKTRSIHINDTPFPEESNLLRNPGGSKDVDAEVCYSQALTSMCFPLAINTPFMNVNRLPPQFDFNIAKEVFIAERNRLQQEGNWFNLIKDERQNMDCCCYITTACMLIRGLPDDCEELTVLRQLRDEYIVSLPHGKKLVKLYYAYAPAIVLAIDQREDYFEIYQKLYRIIRLCVDLTLKHEYEAAFAIYCYMVHHLQETFLPEVSIDFDKEFACKFDQRQK